MVLELESFQESIETTWMSMMELTVTPGRKDTDPGTHVTITACVQILGEWQGAVSLECPIHLARQAASAMLAQAPEEIDEDLVLDAIGELINIIGGNFKSLLPEPCSLSLPAVTQGSDYAMRIMDSQVVSRLPYLCGEDAFEVTIIESRR